MSARLPLPALFRRLVTPLVNWLPRFAFVGIALTFSTQAAAVTGVAPPSIWEAEHVCDENTTPWESAPATPGRWFNPERNGTGWDLFYSEDGRNLRVVYYTYDRSGRPVWFDTDMEVINASDGTWRSKLRKWRFSGGTATQVPGTIAYAAFRFFPHDPSRFAVRWDWDELRQLTPERPPQLECITDLGTLGPRTNNVIEDPNGGPGQQAGTVVVNQAMRGYWAEGGNPFGYNVAIFQTISPQDFYGRYTETTVHTLFDSSGEPVWLGTQFAPATNFTPLPASHSDIVFYSAADPADYPEGIPVNPCSGRDDPANCMRRTVFTGTQAEYFREFTSPTQGKARLVVNAAPLDGKNVAQSIVWNRPATGTRNISKTTSTNFIGVTSYTCSTPSAMGSCNILINWGSAVTAARPYRHNLVDNSRAIIGSTENGNLEDVLLAGSRVRYQLWNGDPAVPASVLLYETAEVRAVGPAPPAPDISSGAADAPPAPQSFSPPAADVASDLVGAIAAEFRVDESGNANYRIPLVAARGAGGFTPTVALTYNSGASDGYAGTGFSVEAASSISPCRTGIEYGDSDSASASPNQFCLDGQRLLLWRGTHRATGAEYRTESETFARIVLEQVVSIQTSVYGTAEPIETYRFAVYAKDGTVRHFGGKDFTVLSKSGTVTHANAATAIGWLQYDLIDASGNQINFWYSSQVVPSGIPDVVNSGERYLTDITYTGGAIKFNYADSSRKDVYASAIGDARRTKQLTDIRSYAADQTVLRRYRLAYDASGQPFASTPGVSGFRPRVTKIQECADDGGTQCYPATNFGWADASTAVSAQQTNGASNKFPALTNYRFGDVDGDGRTDVVWVDRDAKVYVTFARPTTGTIDFSTPMQILQLDTGVDPGAAFVVYDFDGDGLDDVLHLAPTGVSKKLGWFLRRSAGTSFGTPESVISDAGTLNSTVAERGEVTFADFDGDGLPDLLYRLRMASPRLALMQRVPGNVQTPFSFASPLSVVYRNGGSDCGLVALVLRQDNERSLAVDVNGDGRTDLRYVTSGSTCLEPGELPTGSEPESPPDPSVMINYRVLTFAASGQVGSQFFFDRTQNPLVIPEHPENGAANASRRVMNADVNADGFTDMVFLDADMQWKLRLNLRANMVADDGSDICIAACSFGESHVEKVQLLDFDGDGRLDFWYPDSTSTDRRYFVYLFNGDRFTSTPIVTGYTASAGNDWLRMAADFDGDGAPDNVIFKPFENPQSSTGPDGAWKVIRTSAPYTARGMLTSVTDGFGARTEIDYAPLTFSSVYRRDYNAPYQSWGRNSAVFDVGGPIYVVQYVHSSAPRKNDPGNLSTVRYSYRGLKMQAGGRGSLGFRRVSSIDQQTGVEVDTYYNAKFPLTGTTQRSVSRKLATLPPDACLGTYGTGSCLTRAPVCAAGRNATCDDELAAGVNLKSTVDTWRWRLQPIALVDGRPTPLLLDNPSLASLVPSGTARSSIFVARTVSATTGFDWYSTLAGQGAPITYEWMSMPESQYDDYGNPLWTTVLKTGGGLSVSSQSSHRYANFEASWKLGRLLQTTVFTSRDETVNGTLRNTTLGRRSTFTYDDPVSPDARKLLRSEKVEGMSGISLDSLVPDATARTVATYYTLDARGNRIATRTCSADVAETTCRTTDAPNVAFHPVDARQVWRYTKTTYDSLGRYADATREVVSNGGDVSVEKVVAQVTARNAGGDPLTVLDANGVRTEMRYGIFGRKRYAWSENGAGSKVTWQLCGGGNCPSGMALAYVMRQETDGAPTSWTYHDVIGRETIRVTQGLAANDYPAAQTYYDASGNVAAKSEPYFASNATTAATTPRAGSLLAWTFLYYDSLNRVTSTTAPDSGITTNSYQGLSTTTTLSQNANNLTQSSTVARNGLGEIISSTDSNGFAVYYRRDAAGNQTSLERGTNAAITSTYDTLGRKLASSDPDAGAWTYSVNDAGEVIQQNSPRGTCTQMRYDGRGRLWKRTDFTNAACTQAESTSEWNFDTGIGATGQVVLEKVTAGITEHSRTMSYDSLGRPIQVRTRLRNDTIVREYLDQTTFDGFGRVFQTFFTPATTTGVAMKITGERYGYSPTGYQSSTYSAYPAGNATPFYEAIAMNAYGSVTEERRASRVTLTTKREFDLYTGRLKRIRTAEGFAQDIEVAHDKVGNMTWRHDRTDRADLTELFAYDALQRLVKTTLRRPGETDVESTQQYDNEGNVQVKNARAYAYTGIPSVCSSVPGAVTPGPHAVRTVGNMGETYCYDAAGNVIAQAYEVQAQLRKTRSFTYSSYDLPRDITAYAADGLTPKTRVTYEYGPNRERLVRRDFDGAASLRAVIHTVGSAEIRWTADNGTIADIKRYLPGGMLLVQSNASGTYRIERRFQLTDTQGSTSAVLSDWGAVIGQPTSFDAFGKRRDPDEWSGSSPWLDDAAYLRDWLYDTTRQGYTGHEQLDEVGVIHMNGRIYDPLLGRFLQADPFIQSPLNSQSLNRYSYVFNNPMAHTDPSGYFGLTERRGVRTIAAIAIGVYCGYQAGLYNAGSWGNIGWSVGGGFAAGAVQSGTLKGAAIGAVSAFAFNAIGTAFGPDNAPSLYANGAMTSNGFALRALSHGAAGGVMSMLQGGKFGHGFLSAGLGTYLTPTETFSSEHPFGAGVAAAVAGGTISQATGGDFANGAMTAAFAYSFNSLAHDNEGRDGRDAYSEGDQDRLFELREHASSVLGRSPGADGVVEISFGELNVVLNYEIADIEYRSALRGGYNNLSPSEFAAEIYYFGDSQFYGPAGIGHGGTTFRVVGAPTGFGGPYLGGDLNYVRQGLMFGARGSSKYELRATVAMWNTHGGGSVLHTTTRLHLAQFGYDLWNSRP